MLQRLFFQQAPPPRALTHAFSLAPSGDALYDEEASELLSGFLPQSTPQRRKPRSELPQTEPKMVVVTPRIERPTVMPELEGETAVQREIRAHNSSLYNLKGQAIVGRVVAVGKKDVLVDLGWKDYQTFFKSELALSQIYRSTPAADSDHPEEAFQPGDELRFRIEDLATPHGEIFVSTQKMRADIRQQLVWEELRRAYETEKMVMGRVLNPCNAGYAVGVAGFVAFCSLRRMSPATERRIGILQPFMIVKISEMKGRELIVADPRVKMVGRPRNF